MQLVRRSGVIFSIAAFVPLLLLGSFYVASLLQQMNNEAEDKTLSRAVNYLGQVDGKLIADLGVLSLFENAQSFRTGTWNEAREYTVAIIRALPHWKNVILMDALSGEQLWQTAATLESDAPAGGEFLKMAISGHEIGDFLTARRECLCVTIQRRFTVNGSDYVLLVQRELEDLQDSLMAAVLPGETAALVDRNGLFLARTIDYANRLGKPATQYVRDAVARGGEGIYSGKTYEGLKNRTAYTTSSLSGWSAHIAVPVASYNLLSAGYLTFALSAILIAFGFAGAVVWYATYDLSKRRRDEQTRMRSQKLEAIGYLSGAVAHDFNNLLAVMTACFRIMDKPRDGADKEMIIKEGLAAAGRGEKLVRQLLTFARDKPLELDCVDLATTVAGIKDLLTRTLGPGIASEVNLGPRASHVRTNSSQLELVLLNLAGNARDAMPEGGTFSITSRLSSTPGCIDLMVKDTGIGMSKDVAARALEPFFTTKEEGKGTGLGLAQAHLLMKQSGGSLHLDTAPGKGALFIFCFPACKPSWRHPNTA